MDQIRFAKGLRPSIVEVAGCRCKLFFSLRAALAIEAKFEKPYLEVVLDMLQAPAEDGSKRTPLSPRQQAEIIVILMAEAGQVIEIDDLLTLHMVDFTALCRAAQAEILLKMPEGGKKKPESNPGGTGAAPTTVRIMRSASPWMRFWRSLRRRCTAFWRRLREQESPR